MPPARQLELIPWENPLERHVGREFFCELPEAPGVYRMLSLEAEVLYVGSSRNLRHRVASYRSISPGRHPQRLCRLVHAARAIHIELTASEMAARELEASWIRHYRPRFNRALNRPVQTIWIGLECRGDDLITRWTDREQEWNTWPKAAFGRGPYPHRQHVNFLQILRRTLTWTESPEVDLREFPGALLRWHKPPRTWRQRVTGFSLQSDFIALSKDLLERGENCREKLTRFAWNRPLWERWEEDQIALQSFTNPIPPKSLLPTKT
jgi:hypothetical protein